MNGNAGIKKIHWIKKGKIKGKKQDKWIKKNFKLK